MSKLKNKLNQIAKTTPTLLLSGELYLTSGWVLSKYSNTIARIPLFLLFFIAFGVFAGTIIYLMDLKYIGKRFSTTT